MNFRRDGVASRYAVQRVCSATADADAGAEGVAGSAADAGAGLGLGLGLEAGVVAVAVEACFGVLGPAIMCFLFSERDCASCMIVGSSRRRVQFHTRGTPGPTHHCSPGSQYFAFGTARLSVSVSASKQRETFQGRVIMHRVARSLATARCTKITSAARLAARSLRSASVVRPPARPAAAVGALGAPSCRTIHVRVPLPYKIEDGLGDFLSPEALKVIAEDYQQGLLDRLNEQIKGALFCLGGDGRLLASSLRHSSAHI